jgi:hypothetical protein
MAIMSQTQSGESQVVIAEWQLGVFHPEVALNDRESPVSEKTSQTDLKRAILRRVAERTWGRVHSLSVEVKGRSVVINGRVDCFHLKQLALQGVLETLGAGSKVQIELNIAVDASESQW